MPIKFVVARALPTLFVFFRFQKERKIKFFHLIRSYLSFFKFQNFFIYCHMVIDMATSAFAWPSIGLIVERMKEG